MALLTHAGGGRQKRFPEVEFLIVFSHRFTCNLLFKALKILKVRYVMLKIMVTHNLQGSTMNSSLSTIYSIDSIVFFICTVSMTSLHVPIGASPWLLPNWKNCFCPPLQTHNF